MKKRKVKPVWKTLLLVMVLLLIYPTYLTVRIVSKNYDIKSVYNIVQV